MKNFKPADDGPKITPDLVAKWNQNVDTTNKVEADLEKLKKEFIRLNADKLRQDMQYLN